ncbi:C1 family peptidase [Ideonella sp. A 288]|uniref:C1 family peptidase n=1 Tax=Ideonella sp. A 288 TaxID=1962181 RepID=UPI00118548F5|nr:C1 family peptidase [Ideonella sp. A 288]
MATRSTPPAGTRAPRRAAAAQATAPRKSSKAAAEAASVPAAPKGAAKPPAKSAKGSKLPQRAAPAKPAKTPKPAKPAAPSAVKESSFANGLFDARPDRLDFRDLHYAAPLRSLSPQHPPPDQFARFVPGYVQAGLVLDQGNEGACTGFGLAAVINYLMWLRQGGVSKGEGSGRVSPRMLYELARRYDEWPGDAYEGSSCRGALKGWHKHGVCLEDLWPHRQRRVAPLEGWDRDAATRPLGVYYRINRRSVTDLQAAICQIGAVYVSAKVHDGWDRVETLERAPSSHGADQLPAVPPPQKPQSTGGHAFALVGYNERGFIVQNSWGDRWGACGFAVLPYDDWVRHGTDAWAVALGVAQVHRLSSDRIAALRWPAPSGRSLGSFDDAVGNPANPPDDPWPIDREFEVAAYQPWSTAKAYEHTLVTGNEGRLIVTDVLAGIDSDPGAFVDQQVAVRPLAFLQAQPVARLVIYAHGGLNSQDESIDRIRVLAPYFEANGIYPLFLTWRTGPMETLLHILQDKVAERFGIAGDGTQARGMFDGIGEARDRSVEALARKVAKGLWTEMRENARLGAHPGRGWTLLARSLGRLQASLGAKPLELHLVGHSAGSLVLGHLLTRLAAEPRLPVASCALFAAACSVRFALRHYLDQDAAVLDPGHLHLHHLQDREEKDDDLLRLGPVTLYGKSLLYLVSRALDDERKMPLLGMARALDPQYNTSDQWADTEVATVHEWQQRAGNVHLHPVPIPSVRVNRKGRTVPAAHGAFDNDVDVIGQTIARITGAPLVGPVEWLDY